ncbi:MAG: MMOB1640 family gliding machinery internal complex protein [Metamycoplasmataceae bacterium]
MENSNKRQLLLTTSINPDLLNLIYSRDSEIIIDITILTIDYKPIQLKLGNNFISKGSTSDVITIYDVAALVIKYRDKNVDGAEVKTHFVMAEDVMRVSNKSGDLVMLNGKFDIIPDKMLAEVYKNFSNSKTINLEQLEDILELSRNQPILKAYNQLSNYFSVENYANNNNVFKLLKHQDEAIKVSKKVLLKSIVAWEIRK